MQGEDGLDKGSDAGGGAPQLAQEPPGLEGGHGLFDECADLRVGPVDRFLPGGLPTAHDRVDAQEVSPRACCS